MTSSDLREQAGKIGPGHVVSSDDVSSRDSILEEIRVDVAEVAHVDHLIPGRGHGHGEIEAKGQAAKWLGIARIEGADGAGRVGDGDGCTTIL